MQGKEARLNNDPLANGPPVMEGVAVRGVVFVQRSLWVRQCPEVLDVRLGFPRRMARKLGAGEENAARLPLEANDQHAQPITEVSSDVTHELFEFPRVLARRLAVRTKHEHVGRLANIVDAKVPENWLPIFG